MPSMAIDRRRLFGTVLAGLALPPVFAKADVPHTRLYLSARRTKDGAFRVSAFTAQGVRHLDVALPGRGHSFAVRSDGALAVHFARRPGRFARVLDLTGRQVLRDIAAPEGRHFYGHGVFAADGALLYATENDYEAERGVIGVYDASNGYRRLGELSSHGIGPHDMRLLSDGVTLAVANGGIATRPDLPRVKLNLPTMAPSLVYLDRRDGRLLDEVRLAPEFHQLSIRHLAVGAGDRVAIAMQYEGPFGDPVPLVALHRRGEQPLLLEAPRPVLRRMRQYCGGAAFDRTGRVLAISAPRGNRLVFWDALEGRFLSSVGLADGCGVAPTEAPGQFLASSGVGGVIVVEAETGNIRRLVSDFLDESQWDNHMLAADS